MDSFMKKKKITLPFICIVYVPRPANVNKFIKTLDFQHKERQREFMSKLWGRLGQE